MQLDISSPVVAFLVFVVIFVGVMWSWQYPQALKKYSRQTAVVDEQQRETHELLERTRQQQEVAQQQQDREAALLNRCEALVSRVERLVQRFEEKYPN